MSPLFLLFAVAMFALLPVATWALVRSTEEAAQ